MLPAAGQVAEHVVRQLLDRAFERLAAALEVVLVIARNRDLAIDLGQRDLTVGVARLNALDLAGIAITIEADANAGDADGSEHRSEARRVGKACVSTSRSQWSPYHENKKHE